MKNKIFLVIFLIFCIQTVNSQINLGWGLKGGLNFSLGTGVIEDSQVTAGYHVGTFLKLNLTKLYLRPELVYTKAKSRDGTTNFEISKIDMPLLVGVTLIKPLSVFAGPSFQYVLNAKSKDISLETVENEVTLGYTIGTAVQLGRFRIDLRYENGFLDKHVDFLNNNGSVNTTLEQIILGVSVKM